MSTSGGICPAATASTMRRLLTRPQPLIWSQPAVVTNRREAGIVVTKLWGRPHGTFGVEKSMSSAPSRKSCLASDADSGRPDGSGSMIPRSTALRAAEYSRPAMPADWATASDEHDVDGTEAQM